jgi:hypothetical protein
VRVLHVRNDGMIRASAAAITVFDPRKTEGGTASAVRKLTALGLPVVHVNPRRCAAGPPRQAGRGRHPHGRSDREDRQPQYVRRFLRPYVYTRKLMP